MSRARATRRAALALLGGAGLAALAAGGARAAAAIRVHKTPWCGCCRMWVAHLEAEGFAVEVVETGDLGPVKRAAGVPPDLAACHTGAVAGYTVEGHVPADAIRRLLAERPDVRGLAVPGMPAGAPGMPSDRPEAYDVFAFTADGGRRVFQHVAA